MTNPRRKRKKLWKTIFITVTLGTTLPVLALLCRGTSPSRYDVSNLPVWERMTPAPPAPIGRVDAAPLPAANIHFASVPIAATLLRADENNMFSNIENTGHVPPQDRLSAGKPGVWLEQAAVVSPWSKDIAPVMNSVAARLMTAQDAAGYLGAVEPVHEYTADDISAHANNLRGLLAYYHVTHQPAALYAAIRGGDFLIDNYDPAPGSEETGAEDGLVYALTRLYQACGDTKYLHFAEREEAARGCDGLGLCALYEATGKGAYLKLAERSWKYVPLPKKEKAGVLPLLSKERIGVRSSGSASPQFSAEIFSVTGNRRYLDGLRDYRSTSVWPMAVAFTRGSSGLSINCLYPATVRFGDVQLDIKSTIRQAEVKSAFTTADIPAEIDSTLPRVHGVQHPLTVEAEDILLTTKAHVSTTVHITLQPGCVAAVEDRSVEISMNGKPVRYDGVMGSRLALRPIGPPSTKPASTTHSPLLKTEPAIVHTHGGSEA